MRFGHPQENGLALLPVVLVLLTVGSIAFLLNHQAAMHTQIATHSAGLDEARYVAEAGLAHELWRLQQADCAGYTPLAVTPFGDHDYEASVTPASGTPVTIEAKATLAGGETHSLTRQRTVYSAPKTDDLQPGSAASQDTYLADGGAANDNFEQALQMLVGDGLNDEHALLRFDLSGLPAGARLSSAVLELNLESVGFSGSGTASVHRVTQAWLAPWATWNDYATALPWAAPGGDYDTTPIATAPVDDTLPGPTQWDITDLVKDWADATVPNEGLLLSASASTDDVTFTSSEGACAERPKLTLTYACECGLPCQLAQATGPVCDGDYLPDANLGEFSTAALGASDL
ncbi:MAG: DNRLRE domain-containing protein, partial [Myxococcales bacterium]|nr:DNRLRE domain-containing protein [Myxococcales bacterium]